MESEEEKINWCIVHQHPLGEEKFEVVGPFPSQQHAQAFLIKILGPASNRFVAPIYTPQETEAYMESRGS